MLTEKNARTVAIYFSLHVKFRREKWYFEEEVLIGPKNTSLFEVICKLEYA